MTKKSIALNKIILLFAGDSGDGIQLTGQQFTNTVLNDGNDVRTIPDFPAEIRAPTGSISGISGFQIQFSNSKIYHPGELCDVLICFNPAAFIKHKDKLKKGGILIINSFNFNRKNKIFEISELRQYQCHELPIDKLTNEVLQNILISKKQKELLKNMFVLGYVLWLYSKSIEVTKSFLTKKFKEEKILLEANLKMLQAGFNFGITTEAYNARYHISKANLPKGKYRNINGNLGVALALIAASKKSKMQLFYSGYPITPASDILHNINILKDNNIKVFQAEDEIAAIGACIGASFGGSLAATGTSGPGMSLKSEGLGLAVMLEIPLIVINVQRGGPSTGLPTKTEQADLLQAMFGRNGESPVPVIAISSVTNAFNAVYTASKIAIEFMTPVIVLSDASIANGHAPWKIPNDLELPNITPNWTSNNKDKFFPYKRDNKLVRDWAIPGMEGNEHRIGGLEKEDVTGNVSYSPENHQKMINIRHRKVQNISKVIPLQKYEIGRRKTLLCIVSWGGNFGVIKDVILELSSYSNFISYIHLEYIYPIPINLKELLNSHKNILIVELNNGQLYHWLQSLLGRCCDFFFQTNGQTLSKSSLINKISEYFTE